MTQVADLPDVAVALDVGGTGIKAALVTADGRPVGELRRQPTGADRGPDAVVSTIADLAAELVGRARDQGRRARGVGVVVPGVVAERTGVAVWSANVGFRDVPLAALLTERVGLPTALGHDVRAGGLAEARLGAGRGGRHVMFVAIGTGIAAAQIVDGHALGGAHGAAGEIGHVVVRPGGPPCGCGQAGCLEAVASAAAIGRRYADLTGGPSTAAEVAALARAGEPRAGQVWREAIEALADGLATGQALYDVEVIVLGGGLAEAGADLLDPLRLALRRRLTFHREPRLVPAALGDRAGCLGAGLLAFDNMETL